ncbi:hypothetical protein HDU81_009107 [Chytriomyces hyalinus]|nr:hypothetical protein HDU81_009107 [Chytriomyces hyalinus]
MSEPPHELANTTDNLEPAVIPPSGEEDRESETTTNPPERRSVDSSDEHVRSADEFKRFGTRNAFLCMSTQMALFKDGNLWQAVYEGDLENVKKYAMQPFYHGTDEDGKPAVVGTRGECERGGEGESILHLAILGMRKPVIEWIVEHVKVLINEVYLKHRYFGETPLHVAVVASKESDESIVQLLVDNGAEVNGPMVTGTEFLKDEEKGALYYGQTILQFAATTHKFKIVRYLVEQAKADLATVDIYGNNVLHVMAYHGHFDPEAFDYIKNKNLAQFEAKETSVNLMRSRNKDNLTPFQLGVSRGHSNIIERVKELHWEFGFVRTFRIPIDDLDSIQAHKPSESSALRTSKSAIEIAADRKDKVIITHPLFESLLQVKWALYARKKFLIRFVLTALLIASFTVCISLQPFRMEDRRTYFSGAVASTNSHPIVRLVFELVTLVGVLIMLGGEFKEIKNQKGVYFTGYSRDENAVQWTFSILVILIPLLRFGVAAAVSSDKWGYILDTENVVFGLAGILGWVYMLYFAKGFERVGPLVLVFTRIIREDFLQWISLYLAVTFGFSAALFLQMNDTPAKTANELLPVLDWNNYLGSTLWVIRFLFAQCIFDDFRNAKLPAFTEFLFVLYGFMVMVLLLNVLIAKLVETFKEVAKDSKRVWKVQFAHLIVGMSSLKLYIHHIWTENNLVTGIDSQMSASERRYWLAHLGWHESNDHGTASSVAARRYFIFTERDIPDPEEPSKKVTETLKLVVAKSDDGHDVEVRPHGKHWVGWSQDLMKSFSELRVAEKNAWNDHHLRLHSGKEGRFQRVNKLFHEKISGKNKME